jgi:NAD(P)H-hydrate epimerase
MTVCIRPLSRQEIRGLDIQAVEQLNLPTAILMENAGRGAASWLGELSGVIPPDAGGRVFLPVSPTQSGVIPCVGDLSTVTILCGPGNNGGDGAVVARHLNAWGFHVRVIWFAQSEQLRGDAALQWAILERSGVEQTAWFDSDYSGQVNSAQLISILTSSDWLVDGLLGTGLSRPVEGAIYTVIEVINHSGRPVFALDLPSGMDADTGQPLGIAVRACATATFVAAKLGFSNPSSAEYTGQVAIIDIGLPRCLLEPYIKS